MKRILTAVKPTDSQYHVGNYFGAVKPFIEMSDANKDAEIFLFLANMHALTTLHDAKELRQNSINMLKLYAACGADLSRYYIFSPADVPAHAQLHWVFSCLTNMGTMERMHCFKEAVDKGKKGEISVGTFCYPILMAADVLLYDSDIVPIGKDQKQHMEYARDMAQKFNRQYGETFKVPEVSLKEESIAWIPGTDGNKMSKTYHNYIGLLDDEKTILKTIKQIQTGTQTIDEPKNPDECNVYRICRLFLSPEEDEVLRKRYMSGGLSYKEVKDLLYEKIIPFVKKIQQKYAKITDQEIIDIIAKGAKAANLIAEKKIAEVYKKIGFTL